MSFLLLPLAFSSVLRKLIPGFRFRIHNHVDPIQTISFMSSKAQRRTKEGASSAQASNEPTDDLAVVQAQKQALRKEIRTRLKSLTQEQILQQSQKVWNKIIDLPIYQTATSVGVFISMPQGEINTDAILRQCVADGKTLYVPQVGKDFENPDMELVKVPPAQFDRTGKTADTNLFYETWPRNKWNIPEPPPTMPIQIAQPGHIDFLVVPGLAFDQHGSRLGQGKGYYDRFIPRMMTTSAKQSLKLVAVCLDCQLVKDSAIPVQETDQPMHMIVSPNNTIVVNETLF